jgi:hypothetical protein
LKNTPPCQRVLGLALVEADLHAPAQLGALQPLQREQRALELRLGDRQAVLPRMRGAKRKPSRCIRAKTWSVKPAVSV